MTNEERQAILDRIKASIDSHGYHVRIVDGGPSPRFAYTIGLHGSIGFELVFAGGSFFTLSEAKNVVNETAQIIRTKRSSEAMPIVFPAMGTFSLGMVDPSWSRKLLLGALDYFGLEQIRALQIVPDEDHWTFDIPNMDEAWNPNSNPAWKWLEHAWELPNSPRSAAITNLDALRGHPITEVMRWEEEEWEMFAGAGPDVDKSEVRIVPLATMVAHDASLEMVFDLAVGSGLWREEGGDEWHPWK